MTGNSDPMVLFHKTYGEKIPVRKFTGMLPMEYVKKIDELYA